MRGVSSMRPWSNAYVEMDATELTMLLDGIDLRYVRRPPMWEPQKKHA